MSLPDFGRNVHPAASAWSIPPKGAKVLATSSGGQTMEESRIPGPDDFQSRLGVLRQSCSAEIVAAIERLVQDAPDHKLCRIYVLDFATKAGFG